MRPWTRGLKALSGTGADRQTVDKDLKRMWGGAGRLNGSKQWRAQNQRGCEDEVGGRRRGNKNWAVV